MATETKTFYPGAPRRTSSSSNDVGSATNAIGQGINNTIYAAVNAGRNGENDARWPFDCSVIPQQATIDSVQCQVKCAKSVSGGSASVQMYTGSGDGTAKGASTDVSQSATVRTLNVGSWTRSELETASLGTRSHGTSSSAVAIRLYGAELTVQYTYQSEKFMLKLGGTWHDVARVFKKVNGIWVEQESLEGVVDTSKKLVTGGEIN